MTKKNALILLPILAAVYFYVFWVEQYFGPGAKLMFSVVFVILALYLLSVLFQKKKKK